VSLTITAYRVQWRDGRPETKVPTEEQRVVLGWEELTEKSGLDFYLHPFFVTQWVKGAWVELRLSGEFKGDLDEFKAAIARVLVEVESATDPTEDSPPTDGDGS
jgi:aminoglycoside phosphotransferase (APT) family kinase protein